MMWEVNFTKTRLSPVTCLVECNGKLLEEFSSKAVENLALMEERWPDVTFRAPREHH
jgi:hypothetical protein